jgi:ring-1,2-phenylacetyl-CoA epoxidase subunit PaaE
MDNTNRRVKRGWMNLKVSQVIEETHDTKTFVMVDADEGARPWDYWAGQYLTFRFDSITEKPVVRSYTMSSSPNQLDTCAFTVKRVDKGLISNWLCDHVKVGDILRARGPIGRFIYESEKDLEHLVMVAAGSGVTPFVSIMREFENRVGSVGAPQKMSLLVSYRSREDLILWDDLKRIAGKSGCKVYTTLSRDSGASQDFWQGRINREMIECVVGKDFANATFMSCGPTAIMDLTSEVARTHGVASEQIKTESFES